MHLWILIDDGVVQFFKEGIWKNMQLRGGLLLKCKTMFKIIVYFIGIDGIFIKFISTYLIINCK